MSDKNTKDRGNDARPMCKYGTECYRKNPAHFEEYRHPGMYLCAVLFFARFELRPDKIKILKFIKIFMTTNESFRSTLWITILS